MKFFTGDADALGQQRFNVHMHIFKAHRPGEFTSDDFCTDLFQSGDDLVALGVGQHAYFGEHGGMGDGAINVVMIEAVIKTNGGGKTLDKSVGGFTEAAAPGFDRLIVLAHEHVSTNWK